jgi:hypothetical protein
MGKSRSVTLVNTNVRQEPIPNECGIESIFYAIIISYTRLLC